MYVIKIICTKYSSIKFIVLVMLDFDCNMIIQYINVTNENQIFVLKSLSHGCLGRYILYFPVNVRLLNQK